MLKHLFCAVIYKKMDDISCNFVKTDITLVKFFQKHIFIGNGHYLYIYDAKGKFLRREYIFSEPIFGISIDETYGKILVHGGKFLKLYAINLSTLIFEELVHQTQHDWILVAKFVNNSEHIVTVSMHNVVTLQDSSLELELENERCVERCISYCAHLANNNWHDLIILSGTVFNQILLWKPTISSDGLCPVLCRLIGHKGVIFSIDCHPKLSTICTTSDDRTAIVWHVKDEGFRKELNGESPKSIEIQPKYTLAGHAARVFKCKILDNFIITGGEDGLVNIWNADGKIFRKIHVHQNAPIWSFDYSEESDQIVTGGGDGEVFLVKLHSTTLKTLLPRYKCENPKRIALLSDSSLVCLSENGVLSHHKVEGDKPTEISTHDDLKSYGLLEKSPCGSRVALAGQRGNIHVYDNAKNGFVYKFSCQVSCKQRIFSLHWLSCRSLITTLPKGVLIMWIIEGKTMSPIHFWELPYGKERWTTAASSCGSQHVIVGDRKGYVYLYSFETSQPVQVIKRTHNYLGITNLYFRGKNRIVSLGRNSNVNEYQLDTDRGRIVQTSSHKVPFTWLTNLHTSKSQDCTLLLGFSGANLIVYDYSSRRILLETDCGGGHRSWDLYIENNQLTFVYVKDKRIHFSRHNLADIRGTSIISGYHSSEINVLKLLNVEDPTATTTTCYFISGGEDTVLRICSKNFDDYAYRVDLEHMKMLKSHLSSIRTIESVKIDEEKYLVFSGGGRCQILLWELAFGKINGKIITTCHEKCNNYERNDSIETRVMAVSALIIKNDIFLHVGYSDGRLKIFRMDLQKHHGTKLVQIEDISPHKSRCILQVSTLSIGDVYVLVTMATDGVVTFTNITDVFSSTSELKEKQTVSFKLHQSGINSFHYYRSNAGKYIFLTGGDDTAISLNAFDIKAEDETIVIKNDTRFVDESYHGAQVSGAHILEKHFLTTSVDQKVLLFRWDLVGEDFQVRCIREYDSSICDIQGMECKLIDANCLKVFVYGRGFEILTVRFD